MSAIEHLKPKPLSFIKESVSKSKSKTTRIEERRNTAESFDYPRNELIYSYLSETNSVDNCDLNSFAETLLNLEKDLFVYCNGRLIPSELASGQFFIEAFGYVINEKKLFYKRNISPVFQKIIRETISMISTLKNHGDKLDVHSAITIIYNLAIFGGNCLVEPNNGESFDYALGFNYNQMFDEWERLLTGKQGYGKSYQIAINSPESVKQSHAVKNYWCFNYFRESSLLVYKYLKGMNGFNE